MLHAYRVSLQQCRTLFCFGAGPRSQKLNATIRQQAKPVNAMGVIANRLTSSGRLNEAGTNMNEALHHAGNQRQKRTGGVRNMETVTYAHCVIQYEFTGANTIDYLSRI